HDVFPGLWSERLSMQLRLRPLSPRACEVLARHVLGDDTPTPIVAALCERSGGNAFFLEELLRAHAEGRRDHVPETVLAMVLSRIEALEPEARRVLRAGSVLGQVFQRHALEPLLGGAASASELDGWLARLEAREWIVRRPAARSEG